MTKRVYGIDLGTTYSCIACIDDYSMPQMIVNIDGDNTTPSVVFFESATNVVVGKHAKSMLKINPERVVQLVKRHMGEDWEREFHGETFDPVRVSSLILKQLVNDASDRLGVEISDVVITVPAYFGALPRRATKMAGEAANLNVLALIPEPTAAAIYYGMDEQDNGDIMVYDLGGGTFDVTVIQLGNRDCHAIATDGDRKLGGADWDIALAGIVAHNIAQQAGVDDNDVMNDGDVWNDILSQVEDLKQALTRRKSASALIGFGEGELHKRYEVEITREDFDAATRHLLDRTVEYTHAVIAEAQKKGVENIDKILLVGGSTHMPQIRERLESEFGAEVKTCRDPELAVSKGAAIYAYKVQVDKWLEEWAKQLKGFGEDNEHAYESLTEEEKTEALNELSTVYNTPVDHLRVFADTSIVTLTPKSFGIVAIPSKDAPEAGFNLIPHNHPVPVLIPTERFCTTDDNQKSVRIICIENLRENTIEDPFEYDESEKIGEVVLEMEGNLPAGSKLYIELGYGEDGLVSIFAKDPASGESISDRFESDGVISDDALDEIKRKNNQMTISG